jgi:tetratricopeptide (TPR) repeat protein
MQAMAPRRWKWLLASTLWLAAGHSLAQSGLDTPDAIGETSAGTPDSLLLLAEQHMALGEAAPAVDSIREAIALLEPIDTPDSNRLVDAYVALGDAYAADSLNDLAIDAFTVAQDLSRRKNGLYNEDQIGILYQMSRAALDDGDMAAASRYRQAARDIYRRSRIEALQSATAIDSSDESEFLDARLHYARSLISAGLIGDAMTAYRDTLQIIEDDFDNDSEMKARVLLAQAAALGADLVVLQRARRVINFMDEPDPALRAALRRQFGDWRLLVGLPDKAERAYRDSWELLEGIEGGKALQLEWFSGPQIIAEPRHDLLNAGVLTLVADDPSGTIALDFVVDTRGRARVVGVASADPQWMIDMAVQYVTRSLFRPRFVDGELVATQGRFTWYFRYDPAVAATLGLTEVANNDG